MSKGKTRVQSTRAMLAVAAGALALHGAGALAQTSNDEMKAEIAAQKARLEALERKLQETDAKASRAATAPANSEPAATAAAAMKLPEFPSYLQPYLLIDTSLGYVSNASANGNSRINYQVPWFSGSRWGFRGTLPTDVGVNVIYKLEGEYVTTTGELDTANVLFNRDAWAGFESAALGKITFGRQNTLARDFSQNYGDPYGTANVTLEEGGWTNTNNFKQLIFYAGSPTSTRYDRGLVWKKHFAGGWTVGAGHQFTNQSTTTAKNTSSAIGVGFNGGLYNISGFINEANNNNMTQRSYSIGGNYQVMPQLRLYTGYFHYTAEQGNQPSRSDNAYTFSGRYAMSAQVDFQLGYQVMKASNAALSSSGATLNAFADGSTATAVGSGSKKTLYASAFYHLSKYAEVYIAGDYMKLSDQYVVAATNGFKNQKELVIGLRLKTF